MNALDRIMERQAGRVPVANQIEANRQLGRISAAQTQAFETQELARTDDTLQETLQDALLFNAQAIEPRVTFQHQKPLEYFEYSLGAGARLVGWLRGGPARRVPRPAQHRSDPAGQRAGRRPPRRADAGLPRLPEALAGRCGPP